VLSTLQALDLSNGETLTGWLQTGAKKWAAAKQTSNWTDQKLVSNLFEQSLSRKPTMDELKMLTPLDAANKVDAIEDLLWVVIMLPEFQLIR
jgi:hypothetical protein